MVSARCADAHLDGVLVLVVQSSESVAAEESTEMLVEHSLAGMPFRNAFWPRVHEFLASDLVSRLDGTCKVALEASEENNVRRVVGRCQHTAVLLQVFGP